MSRTCPKCGGPKSPSSHRCHICANKRDFDMRYLRWRKAVLEADHYTCQACGVLFSDPELQAHHIRGYRQNPELRYAVKNGIALCKEHHEQVHRLYGPFNNTWPQMEEYLEGCRLHYRISAEKKSAHIAETP